jgi:hypothetical protein
MAMDSQNLIFDLEYCLSTIRVEEIMIPGQTFFRVNFSNEIPELTLLRATNIKDEKFWTSIPEGRQKLAEEIGPLIEKYYRSKVK